MMLPPQSKNDFAARIIKTLAYGESLTLKEITENVFKNCYFTPHLVHMRLTTLADAGILTEHFTSSECSKDGPHYKLTPAVQQALIELAEEMP